MTEAGITIQGFFPGAATVVVRVEDGKKETQYPMDLEDEAGYYAVLIPGKRVPRYVFHITYEDGTTQEYLDPYSFAPQITEKETEMCIRDSRKDDPVDGLDVSILQDAFLHPVLGIGDPKTDPRIGFVGGIRGYQELERRVHEDCAAAFAMYPTSIQELFAVADTGRLMPPKSTWFEPKLRSGLYIHAF